jgi:hypothetical protein
VETGSVALAPALSLAVRVHAELTGNQTGGNLSVLVNLRPEDRADFASGNNQGGKLEEFAVSPVVPGRYAVTAQLGEGYVAAMTSGGVDLTRQPLLVGGATDPIDLTVRDDGGTVSGKVLVPDGSLPRIGFLYLLPMDGAARFAQGFAGPDGSYTVAMVAPGSYRVIAVEGRLAQIPYRDAAAMRAYEGKGVTLTVASGQQVKLDVPLMDESELPQ